MLAASEGVATYPPSEAFLATEKYYLKPIQELPSGKGFADIVYLPNISFKDRLPALIIELKYKQRANNNKLF